MIVREQHAENAQMTNTIPIASISPDSGAPDRDHALAEIAIDPFDPHLTQAQITVIAGTRDGWIHEFAEQARTGGRPPEVVRKVAQHLAAIMVELERCITLVITSGWITADQGRTFSGYYAESLRQRAAAATIFSRRQSLLNEVNEASAPDRTPAMRGCRPIDSVLDRFVPRIPTLLLPPQRHGKPMATERMSARWEWEWD